MSGDSLHCGRNPRTADPRAATVHGPFERRETRWREGTPQQTTGGNKRTRNTGSGVWVRMKEGIEGFAVLSDGKVG